MFLTTVESNPSTLRTEMTLENPESGMESQAANFVTKLVNELRANSTEISFWSRFCTLVSSFSFYERLKERFSVERRNLSFSLGRKEPHALQHTEFAFEFHYHTLQAISENDSTLQMLRVVLQSSGLDYSNSHAKDLALLMILHLAQYNICPDNKMAENVCLCLSSAIKGNIEGLKRWYLRSLANFVLISFFFEVICSY